jgi:hypothetical protein
MKNLITISFKFFAFILLAAGLIFSSVYAIQLWGDSQDKGLVQYALVDGNVERPGYYRVNDLTTNFDVLKKAGINDSSDVKNIELMNSVSSKKTISVGVTKDKIGVKSNSDFVNPQIVYFIGSVILKRGLKPQDAKIKASLHQKDELLCRADGKLRFKFQNYSEIDVNVNSKIKLTSYEERSDFNTSNLQLDNGQIWVKIPKATPGAQIVIRTPVFIISTKGHEAEFLINTNNMESSIHMAKGNVYVEKLSSGQKKLLAKDYILAVKGSEIGLEEPNPRKFTEKIIKDNFGNLEKAYLGYKKTQNEVSFLFTSGAYNVVVSIIPQKNKLMLMDLPGNTYVGNYMNNVFRLDQSLMYAGAELTREIVEMILGRSVKYVTTIDFETVVNFAYIIDGVFVKVDNGAAFVMGITPGLQRLTKEHIVKYLNPELPGGQSMANTRQKLVLRAILEQANQSPADYMRIFTEFLRRAQTNITVEEGAEILNMYCSRKNWNKVSISMPGIKYEIADYVLIKPDYAGIEKYYSL